MNKKFILLCACALMAAACNKSHIPDSVPSDDHGCIERGFTDKNSPGLSPANMRSADSLMDVNQIDHSRIRYSRYETDTFHPFAPYPPVFTQRITADQYVNGRRIFNAPRYFLFYDGKLHYSYGTVITSGGGNPVGGPYLSLTQLRSLFTRDLLKSDATSRYLTDSCYRAEYGYFNIAGSNDKEPQLVRAWFVSLLSDNDPWPLVAPSACYQDSDGKTLLAPQGPIN